MSEDLNKELNDAIMKCEDILRNIGEARSTVNRKRELESALIEVALNQKGDEQITKEMQKIDGTLADLENTIKEDVNKLADQLDLLKDSYNERTEEKIGDIKEIVRPG